MGLGTLTRFPSQHPQQLDWVLQWLRLDDLGGLFTGLVDDSDTFVAEEVLNGLAGVVEHAHYS